jgi:hypothetical protein
MVGEAPTASSSQQLGNRFAVGEDRPRAAGRIEILPPDIDPESPVDRRQQAVAVQGSFDRFLGLGAGGADTWPIRSPPPLTSTLIALGQ